MIAKTRIYAALKASLSAALLLFGGDVLAAECHSLQSSCALASGERKTSGSGFFSFLSRDRSSLHLRASPYQARDNPRAPAKAPLALATAASPFSQAEQTPDKKYPTFAAQALQAYPAEMGKAPPAQMPRPVATAPVLAQATLPDAQPILPWLKDKAPVTLGSGGPPNDSVVALTEPRPERVSPRPVLPPARMFVPEEPKAPVMAAVAPGHILAGNTGPSQPAARSPPLPIYASASPEPVAVPALFAAPELVPGGSLNDSAVASGRLLSDQESPLPVLRSAPAPVPGRALDGPVMAAAADPVPAGIGDLSPSAGAFSPQPGFASTPPKQAMEHTLSVAMEAPHNIAWVAQTDLTSALLVSNAGTLTNAAAAGRQGASLLAVNQPVAGAATGAAPAPVPGGPNSFAALEPAAGGALPHATIGVDNLPLLPGAVPGGGIAVTPLPAAPAPASAVFPPPATAAPLPHADAILPVRSPEDSAEQGLSLQSRAIAAGLPPQTGAQHKKPIKLEHVQKNPLDKGDVREHNGVGISISVRTPKADVNHMLEEAYDALISGNQEDAITLYQQALAEEPKNKLALFGLATTYHRAGQLQLARPLYGRLLALDPQNAEGLNNFLVLLADESPGEALQEMKKLELGHPDFSPLPAQMAVIYEKMGDYDSAIHSMKRAMALSPENIKYRYDMAVMLDQSGDVENAAYFYEQLLQANERGEKLPAKAQEIQERLTFIRSNKPTHPQ